jgi:hypothetical protein
VVISLLLVDREKKFPKQCLILLWLEPIKGLFESTIMVHVQEKPIFRRKINFLIDKIAKAIFQSNLYMEF